MVQNQSNDRTVKLEQESIKPCKLNAIFEEKKHSFYLSIVKAEHGRQTERRRKISILLLLNYVQHRIRTYQQIKSQIIIVYHGLCVAKWRKTNKNKNS